MNEQGSTVAPAAPARGPDTSRGEGHREQTRLYGLLAEFETPAAIYEAAKQVRDAGYRWWDCCTPFPVHGLDEAMGVRRTILPWLVMGAGVTGAALGFVLQWFTNATNFDLWALVWVRGYDFLVSGKPPLSGPVYPVVMFELTVLISAIGAFACVLLLNKLPMLYHPCFKNDRFARVTNDRFFIVVESRDPKFYRHKTESFLQSLGATAVEAVED